MTYNKNRTVVFVETSLFSNLIKEHLGDDEYAKLQKHLMENPETGKIIRESGGIRKVRWAKDSKGKSGGIRILYYWAKNKSQIFMITLYSKSEKENIDKITLAKIAKQLESIK